MNQEELRNLQAPLKQKYLQQPESAIVTLQAKGKIGENISCNIETGKALVTAGLHPSTGGSGMLTCSGDMLLEALVACAGVTLRAVATSIGIDINDAVVRAEGDLDFRGTLGVSKDVPVGFQAIRLFFHIDSQATADELQALAKLTERYCVVYQTLVQGIQVETKYFAENYRK